MANRTGGQILVDQLLIHGATDAFCVPGESYLAVLDALHDASMKVTICRAEGGACMMAEAAGKLTGKPGICFVTRGPGATNASPGIHIADQDSTPLILFVGQIDGSMREREAFQELDYRAVFGTMTKWATEIDDAARIPEIISRAFHIATSGRPGPVVIALPEDVLTDLADVADAEPYQVTEQHPAQAQMADLARRFAAARSPVAILGGSRWSPEAIADFQAVAERFDLPVAVSFRRQMLFPADHPNFAGDLGIGPNPKLLARIKESDLVLLVGGRLSEMPSQSYTLFGIPNPGRPLVHVHADPEELGRVYRPTLAINASPVGFCAALKTIEPPKSPAWKGAGAAAHEAYIAWSEQPTPVPGEFHPGEMVRWRRSQLARLFYKLINSSQRFDIPQNAGDFRVMRGAVVKALTQVRDKRRFNKGLFAWAGFRQKAVLYTPDNRASGTSKWSRLNLLAFSLEGFTSFSVIPLRIISLCGVLAALAGAVYGAKVFFEVIFYGIAVPGYPSLLVVVVLLGGLNLTLLGLIGEYVWVTLSESKDRPVYIVRDIIAAKDGEPGQGATRP